MRILLTLVLGSYLTVCVSQETKRIRSQDDSSKREFFVLKNDRSIKHGSFTQKDHSKRIIATGHFNKNLKDSIWTIYHRGTEQIKEQGRYSDDVKVGEWSYFDRSGNEVQVYDHSKGELVRYKSEDPAKRYLIRTDQGTDSVILERPPMYIGGMIAANDALNAAKLKYPQEAVDAGIQGTVLVSFYIDQQGKAIDHKVHTGISPACDEEALRVVKEIPNNWVPGILNGQAVITQVIYPVDFILRSYRITEQELQKFHHR